MNRKTRRIASFLRWAKPLQSIALLIGVVLFVSGAVPLVALLKSEPAWGDGVSVRYLLLDLLIRGGALGGGANLYDTATLLGSVPFQIVPPLPYMIMRCFALVLPPTLSFNLGIVLPIIFLPFATYLSVRWAGARFPVPIVAAVAAGLFLFPSTPGVRDGSAFALLSGDIGHGFGLCFLVLCIGATIKAISHRKLPWFPGLLFGACIASDIRTAWLCAALVLVSALAMSNTQQNIVRRLGLGGLVTLFGLLVSVWFWGPALQYRDWFDFEMVARASRPAVWPRIPVSALPLLVLGAFSAVFILLRKPRCPSYGLVWLTAFVVCFVAAACLTLFRFAGQLNGELLLVGSICAAVSIGIALRRGGGLTSWFFAPVLIICLWWWGDIHDHRSEQLAWSRFSGWSNKALSFEVAEFSRIFKGDAVRPRVLAENHPINQASGTDQVFLMMPYLARAASASGSLVRSSLVAPIVLYTQKLLGNQRYCPFLNLECPDASLELGVSKLPLLGIREIILVSDKLVEHAQVHPALSRFRRLGPWASMHLRDSPPLVYVHTGTIKSVKWKRWKQEFFWWFQNAGPVPPSTLLALDYNLPKELPKPRKTAVKANLVVDERVTEERCQPAVKSDPGSFTLRTNCPGEVHVLRFAYHPGWRAESGVPVFMVSPGFIAVVPSSEETVLRFGQSGTIWWSRWVSYLAIVVVLIAGLLGKVRAFRAKRRKLRDFSD